MSQNGGSKIGVIVAGCTVVFGLILCAALIPTSYVAVKEDEACEVFYMHTRDIEEVAEAGAVWKGPGVEKHCLSKATQHLSFSADYFGYGLNRVIKARTSEGLEVTLEIDVEYRYQPDKIKETSPRTGFDNAENRLYRTARAELRNSASEFTVDAYLSGERGTIATTMESALQNTFIEKDGIFIDIVKVNLLHIQVYPEYEDAFQLVEDRKLAQKVETNNLELIRLDEKTLLEQQLIGVDADRKQRMAVAEANTIVAGLEEERLETEAQTVLTQQDIEAKTARETALIRVRAQLNEEEKVKEIKVAEATREAQTALELAKTARQSMIIEMKGALRLADSNADRDIAIAQLAAEKTIEALKKEEVTAELDIFDISLRANLTSAMLMSSGDSAAAEEEWLTREKTEEFRQLKDKLKMSSKGIATLLMERALAHSKSKTVTLDYDKIPFLNEFSDGNGHTNVNVNQN